MPGRALSPMTMALLVGLFTCFLCAKPAAAVPSGFEDETVASVPLPSALTFTPDGRMLVTSKSGQLRVYENDKLLETPALDISSKICDNGERGLLGVAVDPDFGTTVNDSTNDYVYLYYTYNKFDNGCPSGQPARKDNPVNRVSRFTMSGNIVDPFSEKVLVDNIPSPNGNHNAGDLKFGKDGYLYISVGDGACDYAQPTQCQSNNSASRDRNILLGKVLRVTRDGEIPASNPYTGAKSARCGVPSANGRTKIGNDCQETFARGLRNPFRMAFDPDAAGTSFRINDVGGGNWEEIDQGKAGADYAWNLCEGNHDNPHHSGRVNCGAAPFTPPIHNYSHRTGCSSITGSAFVPDGVWPAEYDKAYLYGDYVCGKIFNLMPKNGGGFVRTDFATGLGQGGPIAMTFGPNDSGEALYYTTFANGGEVHRIVSAVGNRAPIADVTAEGQANGDPGDDAYGDADPSPNAPGFQIGFDASASSDPDGNVPLKNYAWDFDGDGNVDQTTDTATVTHTYAQRGKYTVSLTVEDSLDKVSNPVKIDVFPGDMPPQPEITGPADESTFAVGQDLTATGRAIDPDDGDAVDLSWEVLRHHDGSHAHPWDSGAGTVPEPGADNEFKFSGSAPEGLYSTDPQENYLEMRLTATDSLGLSKTVTREVRPKTVELSFATKPYDFGLRIDGEFVRTPETLVSWEDHNVNVSAPPQRLRPGGRLWVFRSWSDGGPNERVIVTPVGPTSYEATFGRTRR